MDRVPEPELMDEPAQALAYARADFSEPHQRFVDLFLSTFPRHVPSRVLDLGCGPADMTLRFARAHPACRVTGVDGAGAMLALAREAVLRAGLEERVEFVHARLPDTGALAGRFDTVISNSLLHHLADPAVLWQTVRARAAQGAAVYVMDLIRPESPARAEELVQAYAANEPEILRRDFRHSLCAAFTPDEIRRQLEQARLPFAVEAVSDRHVLVSGLAS